MFLFLIVGSMQTQAQKNEIKFENISIRNGLSQSFVTCIIQDRQGFMWIGTQDGLNKFDGYTFTVYKSVAGDTTTVSNNYINTIYESSSGEIWVGTEAGLNRFDKTTETFTRYLHDPKNPKSISESFVWSICEGADSSLWVGTESKGLNRMDFATGEFTRYSTLTRPAKLPNNNVRSLFLDSRNRLWVGTLGGGLCLFNPEKQEFVTFKYNEENFTSISNDLVYSIDEDLLGNLWIGTSEGLNKLEINEGTYTFSRYYSLENNPYSLSDNTIDAVFVDSRGTVWAGSPGGGLNKLEIRQNSSVFYRYNHNDFLPYSLINNRVFTIVEDRSGSIWVGTNNGISKFDPVKQGFAHINAIENDSASLNHPNVWAIFEDEEKIIWVGTRQGVTRIDRSNNEYHHYSRKTNNLNSLNDNSVLSIYHDKSGQIWLGMVDGLFQMQVSEDLTSAEFTKVDYRVDTSTLSNNRVYALCEDNLGNLWVGTREGLGVVNMNTLAFEFFQNNAVDTGRLGESIGLGNNIVRSIHQSKEGKLWIGTDGGGLNLAKDVGDNTPLMIFKKFVANAKDSSSINNNSILSIWEGDDGILWLGTYGGGLNKFDPKTGRFEAFTELDGLSNNVVYGVLGDDDGNLWLSTNRGLSKFNIEAQTFKNYAENDGLQSNEFNIGAYFKNQSGDLYFGGINGFNLFNPRSIRRNENHPQVVFTDFKLFNRAVPIGENSPLSQHISVTEEIVLDYTQNNITIEFAALHYSYSSKNQYKYMLENSGEEQMQVVGSERKAHYTNLDPGEYVFKVLASNSDGIWSQEPATLRIIVTPPFWETWWFRILVILSIMEVVYLGVRSRIRNIKAQKEKLEILVQERTKEVLNQKEKIESQKLVIEEEKEKAEKLLLNILPAETVDELKAQGKASARHYRKVSVMFTDVKGFTKISETLRPKEIVAKLDRYFIEFDEIIEKYDIEKIKTIGDAYMCAGGVPIRSKSNPIDMVLAGLEIQRHMKAVAESGRESEPWEIRMGIHTGELIAGVIGIKRFAYDIWGDAVNVASRMEQSGEPGKVNVSGKTYKEIEPLFECTYRGKIPAKNKGEVDMYFVDRIKPELSINGDGVEPNDLFHEYVNLMLYSNINYRNAEKYIMKTLKKGLSPSLYYHCIDHTWDVCKAAERIAFHEGIKGEDMYLLKTAALYHDAGFIKQYQNNEPIGAEMARAALPRFGYTDEQVEIVAGLIHATKVPHEPTSHLQQIICDADLDYLGRDDFHEIAENLKHELMDFGVIKSTRQWDEIQVKFLTMHRYHTKTAIATRKEKKLQHLEEVKQRLATGSYVDE